MPEGGKECVAGVHPHTVAVEAWGEEEFSQSFHSVVMAASQEATEPVAQAKRLRDIDHFHSATASALPGISEERQSSHTQVDATCIPE
jgi:hypothetical protein